MGALAVSLGAVTAAGAWTERAREPEFRSWRAILRTITEQCGLARLGTGLDSALSELSVLLPELRDRIPGLRPPSRGSDPQARARLADAIHRTIRAASASRPLAIVLDYIHLAEAASLDLASSILSDLSDSSLLVIACYRDLPVDLREPLLSFLADVRKMTRCREFSLDNLSLEEAGALARHVLGAPPSADLVARIHRQTRGLPLFVKEMAWLCRRSADEEKLPRVVGAAISRRLDRLAPGYRLVLQHSAAAGERFTRDEAAVAAGLKRRVVVRRALGAGVANGFLRATGGSYQFSHAVVHEAILEQLSPAALGAASRRLAAAVEADHAPRGSEQALRVAQWWAQAGGPEGRARERQWLQRAAEAAEAVRAWEQAAELWTRLAGGPGASPAGACEADALFGLGRALSNSGNRSAASGPLERAFTWYREHGRVERMIAVAALPRCLTAGEPGSVDLTAPLLASLPPGSPLRAAVLLSRGISRWHVDGDAAGADEALGQAHEAARADGNRALQLECACVQAFMDKLHGRPATGMQRLERARAALGPATSFFGAHLLEGITGQLLVVTGRGQEALPYFLRGIELAERERDAFSVAGPCHAAARVLADAGRWEEARAMVERGLSIMPGLPNLLLAGVCIEYATGRFTEGDHYRSRILALERRAPAGPWFVRVCAAAATVLRAAYDGHAEDLPALAGSLEAVAAHPDAHPCVRLRAHLQLCQVGALTRDGKLARRHYRATRGLPPLYLMRPYHEERLLGLAAHAFGDHAPAAAHLEESLRLARFFCDRPTEAMILCDLAEVKSSTPEAQRCLATSMELSAALDMPPLRDRVQRLMADASAPGQRPSHIHLGARQCEVLRLVADGATNKEIALALRISPNTAANHVHSILARTGATNRAEAVSVAMQAGVLTIRAARRGRRLRRVAFPR